MAPRPEKQRLSWTARVVVALAICITLALSFYLEVWWHQFMQWWAGG